MLLESDIFVIRYIMIPVYWRSPHAIRAISECPGCARPPA